MRIVKSIKDLNAQLQPFRDEKKNIGFVPTMGALHEGHLTLMRLAQEKSDITVASIFVNPTQFAPHEDFDTYPREEELDADKLRNTGVDVLFLPTEDVLYPAGKDSEIKAGDAAKGLETDFRPHFFDGVVNIVSRLLNAVKPDTAIFGEKDFQQLQVIKEMVERHNFPVDIVGAPIARDDSGLALSSRNAYLSSEELVTARQLNTILRGIAQGGDVEAGTNQLLKLGFEKIDYIEKRWNRVLGAAWLGKTRLIDNIAM